MYKAWVCPTTLLFPSYVLVHARSMQERGLIRRAKGIRESSGLPLVGRNGYCNDIRVACAYVLGISKVKVWLSGNRTSRSATHDSSS